MRIAQEYGERIKTDNLKPGALESLIADYPSHEFVIDLEEARELFENVREPNQEEAELIRMIHPIMHLIARNGRIIEFLEDMLDDTPEADRADETDSKTDSETGGEHERQIDGTDRADHEEERPEGSDADPEGNT